MPNECYSIAYKNGSIDLFGQKKRSQTQRKKGCRLFIVEFRNLLFRIYSLETITGVAYRYHK